MNPNKLTCINCTKENNYIFYTPSPSLPLNVLVFFPRYLFVFLFVEYHAMHDGLGSETTEEVEPQKQRVIYVNAPQPVKYCYNKIRYGTLLHIYKSGRLMHIQKYSKPKPEGAYKIWCTYLYIYIQDVQYNVYHRYTKSGTVNYSYSLLHLY